jgi:cell division protein FtsB
MRALGLMLTVAVLLLQHRLWLSEDGWRALPPLNRELAAARAENAQLEARNLHLLGELGYVVPGNEARTEPRDPIAAAPLVGAPPGGAPDRPPADR